MRFLRGRPGFLLGCTEAAGCNVGIGGETGGGVSSTDADEAWVRFLRGRPGFLLGCTKAAGCNVGIGGEMGKAENEPNDGIDATTDSTIVEDAK